MKNTAKPTKPRSAKSSKMILEALEPRLLMSAAEDLKTELGSLDSAVDTWVATHVTAQANTKVDGLFGVIAGAENAMKLSDLVDLASLHGIAGELESGLTGVIDAAVLAGSQQNPAVALSLSGLAGALNSQKITVASTGAQATITASESQGQLTLDVDLDWLTGKLGVNANIGVMGVTLNSGTSLSA